MFRCKIAEHCDPVELDRGDSSALMPASQLSPSRVGRYFHLECPRFLRYSATPKQVLEAEGVPKAPHETGPVNRAVLDTGYEWEERALAGFMLGLVQFAEGHGSVKRFTWKGGAKLRAIRVSGDFV